MAITQRERLSAKSRNSSWLRHFDPYTTTLVVVLSIAYLLTLLPGLGMSGDVAEFQFIGKAWGIPHPTGYPLYVFLNGLFVRLVSVGDIAYRANLFSAVCAVLTAVTLNRTAGVLGVRHGAASAAAAAFGCSSIFWAHATIAEVYTLNTLLFAMVMHFLIRWSRWTKNRDFVVACLILAFSFGNHLTMVAFLPAVLLLILRVKPSVLISRSVMGLVLLCVCAGASQYAIMLLRANDPATPFVYTGLGSVQEFWYFVSGKQFEGLMFMFSLNELWEVRIPLFMDLLVKQYHWLLALAGIGLVRAFRQKYFVFVGLALAGNVFFALNYGIQDIAVYFLPTFYVVGLLIGLGVHSVISWTRFKRRLADLVLLVVVPVYALVMSTSPTESHQSMTAAAEATSRTMDRIDGEAVVVSDAWGRSAVLWYETICGDRTDQGLNVLNGFKPSLIRAYCAGEADLFLNETRQRIPRGLDVYTIGSGRVPALLVAGLDVFDLGMNLFLIHGQNTLPEHIIAKYGLNPESKPMSLVRYSEGWGEREHWGRWALESEAKLSVTNASPGSILVIEAATWPAMENPGPIRIFVGNELAGEFRVGGKPWVMQEISIPLPKVEAVSFDVTLLFDSASKEVDGEITRYLAVASATLRDAVD